MDLMIDVGNTNVVLGLFDRDLLVRSWRLTSKLERTEDETWVVVHSFFTEHGLQTSEIEGVCISSVVPELTLGFTRMSRKYLNIEPYLITAGSRLDMKVIYQDTNAVGSDRLCNAVAGKRKYGVPLIILDFGTATTFDCINAEGNYIGGVIAPGLESAAAILHQNAAKLPKIDLKFPQNLIGKNTEESMQSGIMHGALIMIEGMVNQLKHELGEDTKVIATGGLASIISKRASCIDQVEPELDIEGIYQIYQMNRR